MIDLDVMEAILDEMEAMLPCIDELRQLIKDLAVIKKYDEATK